MPFNPVHDNHPLQHTGLQRKPLATQVRLVSAGLSMAATMALPQMGMTQDSLVLEEVIVTAQKRTESMQDVPISIAALNEDALTSLNISGFEDYVMQVPSISFNQRRPGQGQIFMRGVSDGGNINQSLQGPSVAIYLNEQPVTAVGFNLDLHIYDVNRIEVLMGPQGTLYGAASQAGNLRIITNQPDPSGFSSGFDLTAETISDGDESYMAEGFVNIPLSDNAALRLVAWYDDDGGYIDSVADTITYPLSGITRTNEKYIKDDFNENTTKGMRAALRVDLNDSWTTTVSGMYQDSDADGVWDHDPVGLDDFEVGRFFEDSQEDEWYQLALTVEGDLGFADLTYAGGYLDRDFDSYNDYSHYSIDGFVEPYYTCYVSYFGPCVDPSIQNNHHSDTTYQSHELRLASNSGERLHWIVGGFYSDVETEFDRQWSVPPINPGAAVQDDLYFQTDQKREDEEVSFFGEITYDITDKLSGTVGYRWFDDETTLQGFVGTVFWPTCCFGFSPTRPPDNVDTKFDGDDDTWKFNLAYDLTEDVMLYVTYAEGYRPGGANRAPGVGETYDPDFVDSYEFGWKTTLLDGRWRLNGAVYYMEWDDMQLGFFNRDISLLGLVDNVGSSESKGFELDTTFLATQNLELSLAYAYNEAELTDDYFAGTGDVPDALDGQDLPFTPDNKYTVTARYSFDIGQLASHFQVNYVYTDEMYNNIFLDDREKMDDYGLLNATFQIEGDGWHAKLFGTNLTDEVADLYINNDDIQRLVTVNQPLTVGISFGMNFD
jgi:outer membrane receptor protein involved in Fe transport